MSKIKILYLGNVDSLLVGYLKSLGDEVLYTSSPISLDYVKEICPDFIISYGYSYIIKKDIINQYKDKIINMHISFLPYNRGADPNFWSFIEDTPKGVTIHYIDEGIDTGDI